MVGGWKPLPKSWTVAHKQYAVDSIVSMQKGLKDWETDPNPVARAD
jgi:hypothetical protein